MPRVKPLASAILALLKLALMGLSVTPGTDPIPGYPVLSKYRSVSGISNAGFVLTDEGVVVYDALGTPALGYELLLAIRTHSDRPAH